MWGCLVQKNSFRRSHQFAIRSTSRCFGARVRGARPRAVPPIASAGPDVDNLAFAIIKPTDHHSGFAAELLPFRTARRGPDLYSLVTIRTKNAPAKKSGEEAEELPMETSKDVDPSADVKVNELQRKLLRACTGQDRFAGGDWFSFGDIVRAPTARGSEDHLKMQPGSVVIANFDLHSDPFSSGMLVSDAMMGSGSVAQLAVSWNANLKQGYGKIVELHRGPDGNLQSADVAFEGCWSQDWDAAVRLHYPTDTGFYANVQADRLVSHTSFRNIFLTTRLDYLQWEFALLWPEAVAPDDVRFVDIATGMEIPARSGPHSIRNFLEEGTLQVQIKGRAIPVLDPMMVITPKAINLSVAGIFSVGLLTTAVGMMSGATAVMLVAPIGIGIMACSAVVQLSYKSLSAAERARFSRDLNKRDR